MTIKASIAAFVSQLALDSHKSGSTNKNERTQSGRPEGETALIHAQKSSIAASLRKRAQSLGNHLGMREKNQAEMDFATIAEGRAQEKAYRAKMFEHTMGKAVEDGALLHHVWNPSAIAHVEGLVEPTPSYPLITNMRMGFLGDMAHMGRVKEGKQKAPLRETHLYLGALAALKKQPIELPPEVRSLADRAESIMSMEIGEKRGERTEPITFMGVCSQSTFRSETGFANGFTATEAKKLVNALEKAAELGRDTEAVFKKSFAHIKAPELPSSTDSKNKPAKKKHLPISASNLKLWQKIHRS